MLTNKYVWIGAGVGLLVAAYMAKKAVEVAGDVVESVNPFNNENIFNLGANEIYQFLTGDDTGTIGTGLYDFMHKAEPAPGGGGLVNYSEEQRKRDEEAMRRLERGYHGM